MAFQLKQEHWASGTSPLARAARSLLPMDYDPSQLVNPIAMQALSKKAIDRVLRALGGDVDALGPMVRSRVKTKKGLERIVEWMGERGMEMEPGGAPYMFPVSGVSEADKVAHGIGSAAFRLVHKPGAKMFALEILGGAGKKTKRGGPARMFEFLMDYLHGPVPEGTTWSRFLRGEPAVKALLKKNR